MDLVHIHTEFIKLDALLKLRGCARRAARRKN